MARPALRRNHGFEVFEDRRLMAVDVSASTFNPALMGDAIEELSTGNTVGFGYAINLNGDANAAVGSGGQARTAFDLPIRNFSSLVELEVSSVSKPITATAILHLLQSRPGGLDAALKTQLIDYLPSDWNPGDNVEHITLRHLLTHTSGLSETNNSINVNFQSYGNNTFSNLRTLIQSDLSEPNVPADDVYDGPRWNLGDNYNNANFTLLARVVLPKLLNPALDLTAAAFPGIRDSISGAIYSNYVQDNIFEPLGINGADLEGDDANPAKGYLLGVNAPGASMSNLTSLGGAFGWKLSARELATFLDGIQRDNSILWASTRAMRNAQELGWFNTEDAFGDFYSHNGATSNNAGGFRSLIAALPGGIEASYLMNTDDANLPGGSIGNMIKTAYVNGWSDLVVDGTSGNDTFSVTTVVDNGKNSIRVSLNGQVQFTRWLDGLDSITLDGSLGNDTFNITDFNSSVELIINGHGGNDTVNLLSSVENIERVSGMTFNGGSGDDRLVADDESNPYSFAGLSHQYSVTDTSILRHRGLFIPDAGVIPIPVTVNYTGLENLELTTGGQGDLVHVISKTSGETEIRTGAGNDTVLVASAAANLQEVDGLYVDGQTGTDSIQLFDGNKSIGEDFTAQYDVNLTSVSRYVTGGLIINPNPPTYAVDFQRVENLELTTTAGRDRIRVHRTSSGVTVVNGGEGNDVLITTPEEENMELVNDLTFNGEAGVDHLFLNDQQNPYSHASLSNDYAVSALQVARSAAGRDVVVEVDVSYSSVEDLSLYTGNQADVVEITNVTSGETEIHTGGGADVVNASSVALNLETVNDLLVNGGSGNDTLNLFDSNNPYELGAGSGEYTIDTDSVHRFAEHVLLPGFAVPVDVGFSAVENIDLDAGNQGDVFNVAGTNGPAALTLDGNAGADLFNIESPAFGTIYVQGDAPILAPGDQLVVNGNNTYQTADIPGIYPAGSGGVTIGTSSIYFSGIETEEIHEGPTNLPGDTNGDGVVDLVDLNNVRNNFGATGEGVVGDTNGDGVVDLTDLNNVRNNFGATAPAPSAMFAAAPSEEDSPRAGAASAAWEDALLQAQLESSPRLATLTARRLKAVDDLFATF